ncbi:MAG: TIGR02530 family flagellar biosynthesis protein [Lachnospiraceae bacterium]
MQINGSGFTSIEQVTGKFLNQRTGLAKDTSDNGLSFEQVLNEKLTGSTATLKFSKHADQRLADRNINLSRQQLKRLEDGTEAASAKGIKESLMLMDDLAFIVNVKNNTVVTAMSRQDEKEKIFTNIDGAMFI